MRNAIGTLAANLLVCGAALAAVPVDESLEASPTATVEVENLSGSVKVRGWDRSQVQVTGSIGDDVEKLQVTGGPERIRIKVKIPEAERRQRLELESHLEVRVPRRSTLEVETVSADIEALDLAGRLHLESVSGEIRVEGSLESADIETVSGDIDVTGPVAKLDVASVSGELELRDLSGELEAGTVSGDMNIQAGTLDRASLESVSGDIELRADLAPSARLDVEAHSGNVRLVLPGKIAADFRVKTFSGRIDNDFGAKPASKGEYLPSKELKFSTGSAGARVDIETFSGNVRLTSR